ncbi:hypothetical protein PTTG_01411 [Puccinia triticina 1-1 BBBD Race 1]|uniref:AN1-type domain-containing protein n=2 Tax=Puccinia triticina TaxID=208348 RepID=A0A0C4DEZ1_PUCT1|nr:uncharacterized protein PtA15_6A619 [Puccinia triticina]OAV89315.1 hypothetical protein PTTG_01411 [Puccinia triticina 1-1 BBBD Race 1]WAQ85989.1 hypothetical protein PtA15_6A619 [Puccinia triticina]WAR55888.1 hypothetical protein PtB15_6B632 [Puccinia triticina]
MNTTTALDSTAAPKNHANQHQLEEWGAHCSLQTCNLLDFLPLQCPECHKTFCSSHFKPSLVSSDSDHLCEPFILKKKQQERIPKPTRTAVGAQQNKKCSYIKCKTIMLAPINCPSCTLSYCPSHRLEQDHLCKSFAPSSSDSGPNNLGKHVALLKNYLANPLDTHSSKPSPHPTANPPAPAPKISPGDFDPNPFSLKQHLSKIKSNQRSKAELQSQQKALEFRIKNQLLTEKDKQEIRRLEDEKRQKQPPPTSSGTPITRPKQANPSASSSDCCIV